MNIFVMMASKYITIRQKYAWRSLVRVNAKLASRRRPSRQCLLVCWTRYIRVNQGVLHVCLQVRAYSRFWASFLTITSPYYVIVPCYMFYVAVFEQIDTLNQIIYYLAVTEMTLSFYCLIRHCSRVVKYHGKICTANRRFYVAWRQANGHRVVAARDMLKVSCGIRIL